MSSTFVDIVYSKLFKILLQLPDSLCGKGLSDDPNCKDVFDYCLNDLLEGQIGKLLIRKSGKIEVHIGEARYFLEQPELETFREVIQAIFYN